MARVVETLTELNRMQWKLRIWRKLDLASAILQMKADRQEFEQLLPTGPHFDVGEVAETLAARHGVSCVQATDDNGDGFAIFPDWPGE